MSTEIAHFLLMFTGFAVSFAVNSDGLNGGFKAVCDGYMGVKKAHPHFC